MTTITDTAKIHHATRAKAGRLAITLQAETDGRLTLRVAGLGEDQKPTGWQVVRGDRVILETAGVPDESEVLEALEIERWDELPILDEEEEIQVGRSAVDLRYKLRYAQVSRSGQSCGDWLADLLEIECSDGKRFDPEAFWKILDLNGVDQQTSWATCRTKGWQGRYRMTGRNRLEVQVAIFGSVVLPNMTLNAPADWLETARAKHAKRVAAAAA